MYNPELQTKEKYPSRPPTEIAILSVFMLKIFKILLQNLNLHIFLLILMCVIWFWDKFEGV